MNKGTIVLASGIVVGIVSIYAYKRDIAFSDIIDKLEEKREFFDIFIENLISLGTELLEKLIHIITELVREIIFKVRMALN